MSEKHTPFYRAISVHGVLIGVGASNAEGGQTLYMAAPQSMIVPERADEVRKRCNHVANVLNSHADLLAACEEAAFLLEFFHGKAGWDEYQQSPEMKRLRAAIAKAKGGAA